jgi:hypothetical protein
MDFGEAARRYTELQVQRQSGSLSDQQYRALIDQLRVTDQKGIWWQPDPGGTGWIYWNGTQWQPGTPPLPVQTSPSMQPAYQASGVRNPPPEAAGTQNFSEFRAGIMDKDTFNQISKSLPWNKRPQIWWDRLSIMLGIVMAVIWFVYSGIIPITSLLTKGSMREGVDFISPILIVAMPLFLIWKRKAIDNFLMPLQPGRKKFSRKMLIGMGIAVPFLTAFIIYHVFQIDQYPLMYVNIIIGTLASYALVREPVLADKYQWDPQAGRMPDLRIPLALLIGISFCVRIVLADNCLSDPLNAQDCMRTTGTAEVLAGGASALVAGAVNGPTMLQTLSQGGDGGDGGGGQQSQTTAGQSNGGSGDNPNTQFNRGQGPGGC